MIGVKLSVNEMMSVFENHFKDALNEKDKWFQEWKREENCNKEILSERDFEEASIYFFDNHAVNYLYHLHNRININYFPASLKNVVILGLNIFSIEKETLISYDFSKAAMLSEDLQKIITKLGICKPIELVIL